ncbi:MULTISPECIES: beta-ketoacyl synthase N-terminal-like domain-containing protein [unclassified Thiocapsa]|uniref:thiolase family protein n=1 Tax=unclassified Thiocapsa TaxID=2641286 RepID=UPI0035B38DEB
MSKRTQANTRPVYLIDGRRTPFLKTRGVPGPFSAADLAVGAGRPLLLRQPFPAEAIDEVILGCAVPSPEEMNVTRIAALRLGCSERTPAWTVQRNCASVLQALDSAAQSIASGGADLALAGGTDAMSHAPVMKRRGLTQGVASLCIGGGQGGALLLRAEGGVP